MYTDEQTAPGRLEVDDVSNVSNFARHSDGAQGIGWPPGRQSMEYVFCSRRLK